MPELDYVILADYVRQDDGTMHIMAAGLDTIHIPAAVLPAAFQVGVAVRIMFSSQDSVGQEHKLSIEFSGPDGSQLLTAAQHFPTPAPPEGIPPTWRHAVGIAFRVPLPLPAHGEYELQLMLDDDPRLSRTLNLRAIEPAVR
jgi:hypothetical protein